MTIDLFNSILQTNDAFNKQQQQQTTEKKTYAHTHTTKNNTNRIDEE